MSSSTNPENVLAGHKANIHNPNTSSESKEHSKEILKEFHVELSDQEIDGKDKNRVVGGLKAAIHNDKVSEGAKEHAKERLEEIEK